MKIIHLISGGDVGGAKTHVLTLLQGLGRTEKVLLVCFMEGPFAQEARDMGIDTRVMDSGNIISVRNALLRLIQTERFDIIHCHGSRANLLGAMLRRKAGVPVVTTVHSDYRLDYLGRPLHRITYGSINTVALRLLDYRIGVSDAMRELLISRGFDPERIFSIYNGVDFSSPAVPAVSRRSYLRGLGVEVSDDTVVFGIAARLNPVKDISTLIRGFSIAVSRCPDIRLIIAGDGEQAEMLKKQAAETCPQGSVIFAGWVEDMDSFYNALDVNTLSSLSETFPYALTEGIRLHCATISSRVGGVPALIEHGVNGLLFEPSDAQTLSEHMVTMASDREFRETSAERLYEKASTQFSYEATVRRQIEIYTEILQRRKQPKRERNGVLICGAYGHGNAGDEAILEAIISQVREIAPEKPITVLTRTPEETAARHGVDTLHSFSFGKLRKAMKNTALYINGGGSLIQDVTSRRSLMYYLYTLYLAKTCGAEVLMYGCGIGPVTRFGDPAVTRFVLNRYVDAITLREPDSLGELHRFGINKPEILLAADPALTLASASEEEIDKAMLENGLSPDGKYACFCLRPWKGYEQRAEYFAEAADLAYEKYGLTPVFLPINHRSDVAAAELAAKSMKAPYILLHGAMGTAVTIGMMSRMAVVVSMRLHGLIFAAGRGVPLVGVSYDPKVTAFLEYIGEENRLVFEKLSSESLCESLEKALSRDNRKSREEEVSRLTRLARVNVDCAKRFLES